MFKGTPFDAMMQNWMDTAEGNPKKDGEMNFSNPQETLAHDLIHKKAEEASKAFQKAAAFSAHKAAVHAASAATGAASGATMSANYLQNLGNYIANNLVPMGNDKDLANLAPTNDTDNDTANLKVLKAELNKHVSTF